MTYDEVAREYRKTGDSFMIHCPVHDDSTESLSISRGKTLEYVVNCFAGCDPIEIKERLEKGHLESVPTRKKNRGKPALGKWIEYTYPDELGEPVLMVKRTPDKGFPQYQPDGKGGWKKGIKGLSRLVLYNLPDIERAKKEGSPVFFVEGEKDADNLKGLGLVATTSPMGAGKFRQEFVHQLAGVSAVYIIPDNDEPGRKHAADIASKLAGKIPDLRIIELPVSKTKEDVSDWLTSYGGNIEKLRDLVRKSSKYQSASTRTDELPLNTLTPSSSSKGKPFNCTDMGNAERLVSAFGDRLLYSYQTRSWYAFNEKYWEPDKCGQIVQYAKKTVRGIIKEADKFPIGGDSRQGLLKWAMKSEDGARIKKMITLTQDELPAIHSLMDANPYLLNVENGTIDLTTGKLQPFCKTDYITKMCPVSYFPNATAPTWNRFLSEIFIDEEGRVDKELIEFMRLVTGYCLTGSIKEEAFFLLQGHGANGKSTFLEIIRRILPDYTVSPKIDLLVKGYRKNSSFDEDRAILRGARIAIVQESNADVDLDEAAIKQMTTDTEMAAAFKNQSQIFFRPTHKTFLATNHEPRISNSDDGIWRRIFRIIFRASFIGKEDRELTKKLWAERKGILAWMVSGAVDWYREGLKKPSSVEMATKEYKAEQDSVGQFIQECCNTRPGDHSFYEHTGKLSNAYKTFCEGAGIEPLNATQLGRQMNGKGFPVIPGRRKYRYGIQVKIENSLPSS